MYMYIQHRGRAPSLHDSPPTLRPQEVHIGTSYGYKTKCVATRGGGSTQLTFVMGEAAEMWSRFESSLRYNVIHGVFFEHLDGMSIQTAGLDHDVLRIHIGGMIPATSFDLDTYSYGCFICPAANCAQNH